MARAKKSMDGNTAAAHVSYAFTEVASIYPITPSSPMADQVDQWSAAHRKNIFGSEVKVMEMQSEAGAAGTVHGSLAAGALTTTYTASQGLLLMIPNMYKIAGELLPCVFHVSARTVATHALNIFGDHSDVYACRQTGFAMLAESNPQEVMDLAAVAHLATIKGRVPFINFFDGFRTSHEIQKIEVWDYDDLKEMVDMDAINAFRKRALNPERPVMRGSHENGDIFFQHREAANKYYDALPAIVEEYMGKVNEKLGTDYDLFNYYGAPDAERVIIAMGSICDVAEEVIDYMMAAGEKVGLVKVRLYRPFVAEKLVATLPKTTKKIAVLDRTKEPGALGEPLYLDVVTSLARCGVSIPVVVGGRYGLGSKDTPPSSVFAVYENLNADKPKDNFTIGIVDDVTGHSLEEKPAPDTTPAGTISCKFWGLGGDGTVGANKNSIKIIGDHTDKYIQAYFQYDSKKTGGVTISHLRFGDKPIKSSYYINKADFVACHNPSYVVKGFKMVNDVKPGGTFLINCQWTPEELEHHLTAEAKRYIAKNNIQLYTVNAIDKAIDAGATAYVKIDVPASWADAVDDTEAKALTGREALVKQVKEILEPVDMMNGDSLPVSAFVDHADGTYEQGASAYEKRGVAVTVPEWDPAKCIQCNQCSFVCPHATIRPFLLDEAEVKAAPATMKLADAKGKGLEAYKFAMTVSPLDCMGCGSCVNICPAPGKAIKMVPQESQLAEQDSFDYAVAKVTKKETIFKKDSVKGSQFEQPLLEFSGACAGCAETSYAKLITQLFGERMYVSNATGCSSIWGGTGATSPYTVNRDSGYGVTWANSLFEDNAEHGLGLELGQKYIRDALARKTRELIAIDYCDADLKAAAQTWLDTMDDGDANADATKKYVAELNESVVEGCTCAACTLGREILAEKEYLSKKSIWIFGGDGWAYDIGFGGLDHVLASGEDVNVMVFDTEVYSNTGGQASKASQIGQVAQFAAAGKAIGKKDLAQIAMSYGYVYVAHIAMGADYNQTVKAIKEAESYHGPSLIIGYAPCEMHGIKGGMGNCQLEMKRAVAAGYWHLYRFDPRMKAEGKPAFTIDSKAPTESYLDFIKSENRYARLQMAFPERASVLFEKAVEKSADRYEYLKKLETLYK
ncbi:MAG TPA: pyruvate:ferredoxin (flavodoxin) oxidoreductase [Candidatus Pygmaiobacter gallistercoris]|nr:pyruvate:ferredoxin (flavodoxin) oxidoreductase [Candidatus Pygmaiobacter gallistercoris]